MYSISQYIAYIYIQIYILNDTTDGYYIKIFSFI